MMVLTLTKKFGWCYPLQSLHRFFLFCHVWARREIRLSKICRRLKIPNICLNLYCDVSRRTSNAEVRSLVRGDDDASIFSVSSFIQHSNDNKNTARVLRCLRRLASEVLDWPSLPLFPSPPTAQTINLGYSLLSDVFFRADNFWRTWFWTEEI